MAVPTLPAPAMATFMTGLPGGTLGHGAPGGVPSSPSAGFGRRRRSGQSGVEPPKGLGGDHEMDHVPVLAHQVGEVEADRTGPGHGDHGDLAGHGQLGQALARPPLG